MPAYCCGSAALATVHLDQEGGTTKVHVHGGGLVISRMVNEFGIAKRVAAAIQVAFGGLPPAGGTTN
jgi:acetylglutamate kinase